MLLVDKIYTVLYKNVRINVKGGKLMQKLSKKILVLLMVFCFTLNLNVINFKVNAQTSQNSVQAL